NIDITGAYLFGERQFDKSQPDFGLITNPLGAGVYQNYARNNLNITVWNATHKGMLDMGRHYLQWGQSIERQTVNDKLHEWEYQDSAGYNLPYNPDVLAMYSLLNSKANLTIDRISGYVQDNFIVHDSMGIALQAGVRY